MSEHLTEIVRRLEAASWNRPGTDKTWVLNAMWQRIRFQAEVDRAERVELR